MQTNLNFIRAKLATTELLESIIRLQAGGRFPEIDREGIEEHFTELARLLGYSVAPVRALEMAE